MSESKLADLSGAARASHSSVAELADTSITCIDCSGQFIWTSGEQAFFLEKQLLNPPKRCKECKRAKNRRLAAIELAQTTGRPHKIEVNAQCAQCGEKTTVPFYPSQGRPVYCRACFDQNRTEAEQ
jgi:CxxC-x17-CxxC domain-containing protein